MYTKYSLVFATIAFCLFCGTLARIEDQCNTRDLVALHSTDMVTDYRNADQRPTLDTGRFKRDMQGGKNQNPTANQLWAIYKSNVGFTSVRLKLFFYNNGNYPPEQDRQFYIASRYTNAASYASSKKQLTLSNFTETITAAKPGTGWSERNYVISHLPPNTHFFEIRFRDWVQGSKGINYWTPQIAHVSLTELCDPVCGNGKCGERDLSGKPENCLTCPADCGACPKATCGDGRCDINENWAPKVGEDTKDYGTLTCPSDCGFINACGNARCDPQEVCRSNTQQSCSADCCIFPNGTRYFTVNPGRCGNGNCDGSETCSTCPSDCGQCPACGDNICNGMETCLDCPSDCDECPDPITCLRITPITTSSSSSTRSSTSESPSTSSPTKPSTSTSSSNPPQTTDSPPDNSISCDDRRFGLRSVCFDLVCDSCCNTISEKSIVIPDSQGVRSTENPPSDRSKIVTFLLREVNGVYNGDSTEFSLWLDANVKSLGTVVRVSYDFRGDGSYERVELYNVFATDNVIGRWNQWIVPGTASQLRTATGVFKTDIVGGIIRVEIWQGYAARGTVYLKTDNTADAYPTYFKFPFNNLSYESNCLAARNDVILPESNNIFESAVY